MAQPVSAAVVRCGHCKKLESIYQAAATKIKPELPNVRFTKVDTTDDACAETKAKYGITGFPMVFLFRGGEKLYKIMEEVSDRNVERISHLMHFEASQPPPPPPGAPIFMKFDLEGSSKLMEHKIKSQIAFFYAASNPSSTAWISAFEEVATEYAGKIIALYVDIDDPKNRPVLGRFNVNAGTVPCMRVAQIYEAGGGMEIFMPDPKANQAYQDRKVKSKEAMSAFTSDHLAKGDPLKGGRITIPYLRSEPRPMKSHPAVHDLVGTTYDDFIGVKGRACLSFFYMPTCPHCAELEPHWESVATQLKELNKNRPEGAEEVVMVRMNTVRNDVAHFQIFTGSYPTIYWIQADDKEKVVLVNHEPLFSLDEEGMWTHLSRSVEWLSKIPSVQAKVKTEDGEDKEDL